VFLFLFNIIIWKIEMLDGKQITDNSRQFLMSWKASREAQQTKEKFKPDLFDHEFNNLNNGGKCNKKILIKNMNIINQNRD